MPELKVGASFPDDVAFTYIPPSPERDIKVCGIPQKYDASKEFKSKKVILVSVPGAFTPTCQASHLPSYLDNKAKLKAKGVDHVVVIAYNDAYVMSAWGKANGVTDDFVIFASDADAKFSKSIGWTLGERTARYAIAVDHGKVVYASQDDDAKSIDQSGAEAVLGKL
ncbi:redoxin domain-containing protein [Hirsutella rhossiliensis]|uniref:Thioredoxin peroxidase n=1 Tax=Hirsutella rhossiliensis TaxID=111463 RepID=A0A9P8N1D5_9HYPO|nr:redoxin domain-containing protein [Hirsutella rhossiliensis]KAH0964151.1 redoxin domain-containing protein [Hirsutella rhossiliensis]